MSQPTTIIATVTDADLGVQAIVAQITGGYSVVLRDTDADETLGAVRIFSGEEAALAHAARLIPASRLGLFEREAAEAQADADYDAHVNR